MKAPEGSTKAHVELAPSSAHRWMECPGSIEAERGRPNETSEHAILGTHAHALAEESLNASMLPAGFVGETLTSEAGEFTVTEEMAEHVRVYVEFVWSRSEESTHYGIEEKLWMPPSMSPPGEMGGTCDAWAYHEDSRTLSVIDLKYGYNPVEVVDNPQLLYYAALAWLALHKKSKALAERVETVEMTIVQPRAHHVDGPVRTWGITASELKGKTRHLMAAARRAMAPQPGRKAGDHCRWCKAKPDCKTFRDKALQVAQVEFGDITPDGELAVPDPADLTPDHMGAILRAANTLEAWLKMVRKVAMHRLESGEGVTGFALKPRRGNRKWTDEKEVAKWLRKKRVRKGDSHGTAPLKSPAQLEKALKALALDLPEEFVQREDKGFTLTTADDPKAIAPTPLGDVFPALEPAQDTEE